MDLSNYNNNEDITDWTDFILINLTYFVLEIHRAVNCKESRDMDTIYYELMHEFNTNATLSKAIHYIIEYIKYINKSNSLVYIQMLNMNINQIYNIMNNSHSYNHNHDVFTRVYKNIDSYVKGVYSDQNKIVFITHKVRHIYKQDMILRLVSKNITIKEGKLKDITVKLITWLHNKNKGLLVRIYAENFEYITEIDGDLMIECAYNLNY